MTDDEKVVFAFGRIRVARNIVKMLFVKKTVLSACELLSKCKRPLSQLVKDIPDFPQLLVNVKITEDKKGLWDKTEKITDIIAQAEQAMGENGRILVRESGTEPLVRVMIEGKDEKEVHHWTHLIADTIKECLCR